MNRKKVLVAPLDWGLGHATRCIPIIDELVTRRCEVAIASSGNALKLLRKEYPTLQTFKLPSYRAVYSSNLPLMVSIFLQVPKFLKVIRKEHNVIAEIITKHNVEVLISDNRYGCWSENITNIFITHQISIQMPLSLKWIQPVVNFYNHRFIRRFTHCWIPDVPGRLNLTGKLSESKSLPVKYIGILSRFNKVQSDCIYDIAVVLSGPEPQRTVFENVILNQLANTKMKVVVVRGVVEDHVIWKKEGNVDTVNFLQTEELQKVINQSQLIIARSGYSTVMDLAKLGKKAIFIPTPGQTEQEYLADRMMELKIAFSMKQNQFNLSQALKASLDFIGFSNIEVESELLSHALDEVLAT